MKYAYAGSEKTAVLSRPARGAWVEIWAAKDWAAAKAVAPRKGRVG